jgi:hypothetical protein
MHNRRLSIQALLQRRLGRGCTVIGETSLVRSLFRLMAKECANTSTLNATSERSPASSRAHTR